MAGLPRAAWLRPHLAVPNTRSTVIRIAPLHRKFSDAGLLRRCGNARMPRTAPGRTRRVKRSPTRNAAASDVIVVGRVGGKRDVLAKHQYARIIIGRHISG